MTLPAPQLWERQPGESAKAFTAFAIYRDLGTSRTLQAAADSYGRSRQLLAAWSVTHNWTVRIAAWDSEQDRMLRDVQMAAVKAMAERHARQAQAGQTILMAPLQAVLEQIAKERSENEGRSTTLDTLIREAPLEALSLALSAATKLPPLQQAERLARGEPTEIVASAVVDLTPTDTDDLAAVWEAMVRSGLIQPPGELEAGEPPTVAENEI